MRLRGTRDPDHIHVKVKCSCGELLHHCGHATGPTTHLLNPCIHNVSPSELMARIVERFSNFQNPGEELGIVYLEHAWTRLAREWNMSIDQVFTEWGNAVKSKTGSPYLPGILPK